MSSFYRLAHCGKVVMNGHVLDDFDMLWSKNPVEIELFSGYLVLCKLASTANLSRPGCGYPRCSYGSYPLPWVWSRGIQINGRSAQCRTRVSGYWAPQFPNRSLFAARRISLRRVRSAKVSTDNPLLGSLDRSTLCPVAFSSQPKGSPPSLLIVRSSARSASILQWDHRPFFSLSSSRREH